MKYIKLNEKLSNINEGFLDLTLNKFGSKSGILDDNYIKNVLSSFDISNSGKNKKHKYIYLITNIYVNDINNEKNDKIKEDKLSKLKDLLERYEKMLNRKIFNKSNNKKFAQVQNIHNIRTLEEFENFLDDNDIVWKVKDNSEVMKYINKDCPLIAENDTWYIVEPKTTKAAQIFGSGTKWCISSTIDFNRFQMYYDTLIQFFICIRKRKNSDNNTNKICIVLPNNDLNYEDSIDYSVYTTPLYYNEKDMDFIYNKNIHSEFNLPNKLLEYNRTYTDSEFRKAEDILVENRDFFGDWEDENDNDDWDDDWDDDYEE